MERLHPLFCDYGLSAKIRTGNPKPGIKRCCVMDGDITDNPIGSDTDAKHTSLFSINRSLKDPFLTTNSLCSQANITLGKHTIVEPQTKCCITINRVVSEGSVEIQPVA